MIGSSFSEQGDTDGALFIYVRATHCLMAFALPFPAIQPLNCSQKYLKGWFGLQRIDFDVFAARAPKMRKFCACRSSGKCAIMSL